MLQRQNEPVGLRGFSYMDRVIYSGVVNLTGEIMTYPETETKPCIAFLTPMAC